MLNPFSMSRIPNRVLTPLKSTSNTHTHLCLGSIDFQNFRLMSIRLSKKVDYTCSGMRLVSNEDFGRRYKRSVARGRLSGSMRRGSCSRSRSTTHRRATPTPSISSRHCRSPFVLAPYTARWSAHVLQEQRAGVIQHARQAAHAIV